MSDKTMVSIDFGTSRTKMAYYDLANNRVELFRIGDDDKPYIPSVFYLSTDGNRFIGDDALSLGLDDPLGLLDEPLKRQLRNSTIMTANGQKATPKELLTRLISELKIKMTQNPIFTNSIPQSICFTIPVSYGPVDEEILKNAAIDAGFNYKQIDFILEPVAAAQAWFWETKQSDQYIVVLDCGGGTLDWACLQQKSPGIFEIVPELPPGGDNHIGGYDIDDALFQVVKSNASDEEKAFCVTNRPKILQQLRIIKEKYNRTQTIGDIKLQYQRIPIESSIIENTIEDRYIKQIVLTIKPYIDRVKKLLNVNSPRLLLVGGSSKYPSLIKALKNEINCEPYVWERSEFATVLGAIKNNSLQNVMNSKDSYPSINESTRKEDTKPQPNETTTPNRTVAKEFEKRFTGNELVTLKNREDRMDEFSNKAQKCYQIIGNKSSSNQMIQGLSGIFGFPFTLAADVSVIPGIYVPLWSEIRAIYGLLPVSTDSAVPVIKNIAPEVLSDLVLDKLLGNIPGLGIYFNTICAKHMTWRLGTLFTMMSARGSDIVSDNIAECMKLIRMLFPQQGLFSFTTPEKSTFVKLVMSVSDVSPFDYKNKIYKALASMQ